MRDTNLKKGNYFPENKEVCHEDTKTLSRKNPLCLRVLVAIKNKTHQLPDGFQIIQRMD